MIELRLLGQLDLRGSEGEAILSILAQPKRAALLAYLAVARPNGFHRRDKLLGLFWPESDQERGRGSLRKALYLLRQSLGEEVIVGRGDEEIGLTEGSVWCDAVAFEDALEGGNPEEALELYRGDLLEGFFLSEVPEFERWLESERERLRRLASDAAWAMADRAERAGSAVEACRHALRAAGFAPDDEGTLRRLLELLDRVGDRAAAVKEYEAFARRLRDEYEAEPSPETQALIASIRQRESISDAGGEPSAEIRAGEANVISAEPVSDSAGRKPGAEPGPPSLRRALGTYALVSLGVLVGVHIFTLQLGLPDWVFPSTVVVLLVGLPIIVGTALMRGDISTSLAAVALAVTALTLVAAAAIVPRVLPPNRSPSAAADAVSSTSVAVFPFAVRGADELAYLREGMVDLLSTALDGAGELRSVDPQALLSFVDRTEPVTGPEQGGRVASQFGAGHYVLGSIVAAGERIQVSAALYDLEGSVVRRAEARVDDEGQLFDVVDDLSRQLLAAGVGGPGTRLSTLAALTTQSLPALKEYLRGENAYRGGQFDSAVAAFQRAVAVDSTFALGYYRLAVAGSYTFAFAGSDGIDAIRRASRFK
ncbi:MAG: BTAD domain-containing putative transcriptional regulator, partial [Gemmatimonadales bacterium]